MALKPFYNKKGHLGMTRAELLEKLNGGGGGGGGDTYDLVIKCASETMNTTLSNWSVVDGHVTDVISKMESGVPIKIRVFMSLWDTVDDTGYYRECTAIHIEHTIGGTTIEIEAYYFTKSGSTFTTNRRYITVNTSDVITDVST